MAARELTYREAIELLTEWSWWAVRRDEFVHVAHSARVSIADIHRLTGLSRSTIATILAAEVPPPESGSGAVPGAAAGGPPHVGRGPAPTHDH